MEIEFLGCSCVGSSSINGDVFYISADNKLFLLADGASGAGTEGKVLMGKICIEETKKFDFSSSDLEAREYLDKLIWIINNKLIQVSQEYKNLVFGTIDIAVLENDEITIATLGDSPAYFFNGNSIERVAKAPKKYEDMISQDFITREQYESYINNMHPRMWSCFDNFIPMVVPRHAIEKIDMRSGDILVLCCDGISDFLSPEEIIKEIKLQRLDFALNIIIEKAKEKALSVNGDFDDLTIIAIRRV